MSASKRVDIRISPATAKAHGILDEPRPEQQLEADQRAPPADRGGEDAEEDLERKRSSRQRSFLSVLGSNPSMPPPSPRQPAAAECSSPSAATPSAAAEPQPTNWVSDPLDEPSEWMVDSGHGIAGSNSFEGGGSLPTAPLEGFDGTLPATLDISAGIDAMAIYEGTGSPPVGIEGEDASVAETLKLARNTDVSVDWHAQLLEVQKQVSNTPLPLYIRGESDHPLLPKDDTFCCRG